MMVLGYTGRCLASLAWAVNTQAYLTPGKAQGLQAREAFAVGGGFTGPVPRVPLPGNRFSNGGSGGR